MRAIVFATGASSSLGSLTDQYAAVMLPLVDRPFLQHVVETLAGNGFDEFDMVVSDHAHQVEEHFGTGTRWGVTIRYHLARDEEKPYRTLLTMSPALDELPVLICHADRLPRVELTEPSQTPLLHVIEEEPCSGGGKWTGWAWMRSSDLTGMPVNADETTFEAHLRGLGFVESAVQSLLTIRDLDGFLKSNMTAISGEVPALILGGREVEPGVWLSRNVVIHPTAHIHPPVYLSEDCQIGESVDVGPNAIVGPGCIIDRRCTIANSVLFSSSYVGEGLELRDMIVVRNSLIDSRTGVEVSLDDDFLLSSVSSRVFRSRFARWVSSLTAAGLLVIASPLLLVITAYLKLMKGQAFVLDVVVSLPAAAHPERWQTYRLWRFNVSNPSDGEQQCRATMSDLLFRFLPGLINVARGELRFVGVPPRATFKIASLSADWRNLYLRAKAGLITESNLLEAEHLMAEDHPISDAYYAVAGGLLHDSQLVARYLAHALFGWAFRPVFATDDAPSADIIDSAPLLVQTSGRSLVG